MSSQIYGWVEVKIGRWRAVIKVENLVMNVDNTGFRHFLLEVAPGRGLPQDASREAKYVLDEEVGFGKKSWITWAEMNASKWKQLGLAEDWLVLLDLMRLLANTYGDNNVRLVAAAV